MPKATASSPPTNKGRLAKNFKGYDISPDMVRLSLVNMYLHGFTDPHIYEYDTLTIRGALERVRRRHPRQPALHVPERRHQAAQPLLHAEPSAAKCSSWTTWPSTSRPPAAPASSFPKGIIFQSQTAYKELRKMLVEKSLVAVVSLPAGVFQSLLRGEDFDPHPRQIPRRQSDTIAFFKVENDGFGLGAQRRAIDKNDLPQVKAELKAYLQALRSHQPSNSSSAAA